MPVLISCISTCTIWGNRVWSLGPKFNQILENTTIVSIRLVGIVATMYYRRVSTVAKVMDWCSSRIADPGNAYSRVIPTETIHKYPFLLHPSKRKRQNKLVVRFGTQIETRNVGLLFPRVEDLFKG